MTTMIWVFKGPKAGRLMEVTDEEAKQAEAEGWGENMAGRNVMNYTKAEYGPHPAAEEFFNRKYGAVPTTEARVTAPGYRTTEARPASPPPIAEGDQDGDDDGDNGSTTKKPAATKRPYAKRK